MGLKVTGQPSFKPEEIYDLLRKRSEEMGKLVDEFGPEEAKKKPEFSIFVDATDALMKAHGDYAQQMHAMLCMKGPKTVAALEVGAFLNGSKEGFEQGFLAGYEKAMWDYFIGPIKSLEGKKEE